jgi:Fic family protein
LRKNKCLGGSQLKPFEPVKLPITDIQWEQFISLIGDANAELARYDGILSGIINPQVLLSPLMTQEAVLSSKIEGTQATLEEVLQYEASPDEKNEKSADIQEILNYRKAMAHAIRALKDKPINLNMIKEVHGILLDDVRGSDKAKGQFRKIQNYIGKPGSTIEQASYVPPSPFILMECLDNFEKYVHFIEKDRIVQAAIIHAQFELIHPFNDGNGRLGRILIPLFLFEKGKIGQPMFYISLYFEKNRELYYAKLKGISESGDWNGWIEFFLKAVVEQAKENSTQAKAILSLYGKMKSDMHSIVKTKYAINAVDTLFQSPIFNSTTFIRRSKIQKQSAMRIIKALVAKDVLETPVKGRGRRASIYVFRDLLNITR